MNARPRPWTISFRNALTERRRLSGDAYQFARSEIDALGQIKKMLSIPNGVGSYKVHDPNETVRHTVELKSDLSCRVDGICVNEGIDVIPLRRDGQSRATRTHLWEARLFALPRGESCALCFGSSSREDLVDQAVIELSTFSYPAVVEVTDLATGTVTDELKLTLADPPFKHKDLLTERETSRHTFRSLVALQDALDNTIAAIVGMQPAPELAPESVGL